MRDLGLDAKLLHIVKDPSISAASLSGVAAVLAIMISAHNFAPSLLRCVRYCYCVIGSATTSLGQLLRHWVSCCVIGSPAVSLNLLLD